MFLKEITFSRGEFLFFLGIIIIEGGDGMISIKEGLFRGKKCVLSNIDKKNAANVIFERFNDYLNEQTVDEIDLDKLVIKLDVGVVSVKYKNCYVATII